MMKKTPAFFLISTLILLLSASLTYAWYGGYFKEHRLAEARFNEEALRAYAAENGSDALFEYAVSGAKKYSNLNQHQVGHALGAILYEREGLPALGLCKDAFTYGCLHQIIGYAYAEGGTASFDTLRESCRTQTFVPYRECLHALGHGLVYANGYGEKDLQGSLAKCDVAQKGVPFDYEDSCYGGAFMEYNMHFMDDNEGAFNFGREHDPNMPLAPCDALEDPEHRTICAFWLVPWTHGQVDGWHFNEESFGRLGDLCDSMPEKTMGTACRYAVGREAAINVLPIHLIISFCTAAVSEKRAYDECVFGAVRILNDQRPDMVAPLCASVSSTRRDACHAFASAEVSSWDAVK